jgi:hypothetical protein
MNWTASVTVLNRFRRDDRLEYELGAAIVRISAVVTMLRTLHRSSLLVGGLVFATLAFINVPGGANDLPRKHGWPFTYLQRADWPPVDGGCYVLSIPSTWELTSDVVEFRVGVLLGNVVIVLALATASMALFEWWRRRHKTLVQFSLRSLAIALVMFSIGLGWLHYRLEHTRRTGQIVASLEQVGGSVQYESLLPVWLREFLPDRIGRVFDDVTYVSLAYSRATDSDLTELRHFHKLLTLNLTSTRITNGGLENIQYLTSLDSLSLNGTSITDEGLAHFANLSKLKDLGLEQTQVRGPGLAFLRNLGQLESLSVRECPLTESALDHLPAMPKLSSINADRTKISESSKAAYDARCGTDVYISGGGDDPF